MADSLTARNIMVTRLVTLRPTMDVFDAIGLLLRHRISGAPVVAADGTYLGVFSEKCCMQVLVDAAHDSLPCASIECFINAAARTVDEETDFLTLAHIFNETGARRLPVLRDGRLVGQISRRDILRAAHDMLSDRPRPPKRPVVSERPDGTPRITNLRNPSLRPDITKTKHHSNPTSLEPNTTKIRSDRQAGRPLPAPPLLDRPSPTDGVSYGHGTAPDTRSPPVLSVGGTAI